MKVVPYTDAWHERVLDFRHRVYPANPWSHQDLHFRWRFLDNPHDRQPFYLLAVQDDRIIGQWAGLHDRVWSHDRVWPVVWMVDLVVAPEHRDTMAAMALFRAAMAARRNLLVIGAPAFMLPFYQVFRWQRLAVADTFYSVFRPSPLLELAGQGPSGPRLRALRLADHLLPLAHRVARAVAPRPPVQILPAFSDLHDALFDDLRARMGVTSQRRAAELRWKFDQRPCGHHLSLGLHHADGRLRAYMVLKLRRRPQVARWAEVADFLVDPEDTEAFDALVAHARARTQAAGLDFLRLRCSLPQHTTRLRQPWWVRRVRAPMDDLFVHAAGDAAGDAAGGAGAQRALTSHPWSYTAACSDTVDTGLDEWADPVPPEWTRTG